MADTSARESAHADAYARDGMTPMRPRRRGGRLRWLAVVGPLIAYAGIAASLSGCLAFPPRASSVSTPQRVAAFPSSGLPLHAPATIHWNENLIPFIEAADDRDVPLLLGAIHAHQRLGQMEVLKRVSQGRLAEGVGPLAGFIDATLRAIDFGKVAEENYRLMRPDTRAWLDRFVEGINAYRVLVKERPAEFRALGFEEEEWTAVDVLRIGRLGGTDINWGLWASLLFNRDDPKWPALYARLKRFGLEAVPSFGPTEPMGLLAGLSKSGSNSFAVSGARTRTGAALIANDPHVGLTVPNLWLVAGYKSPGLHAVGMMLPGVPAVLLGRNAHIAWGGTNMRSLNTAVYDVSGVPPEQVTTRRVTIKQRWWVDRVETIRETPWGPIMTDTPLLERGARTGPPVAFKWRGHEPSDELTAFLDAGRATTWEEFRRAFEPYAVSGQNFLYADPQGNIGQLLALEFDAAAGRTALAGVGDPANPEHAWGKERYTSGDLPQAYNPPPGYLVSTNNNPVRTDPPVTILANGDDRYLRIAELIEQKGSVGYDEALTIQMDVLSRSSRTLAHEIARRGLELNELSPRARRVAELLRGWDGRYDVDSPGAPAFQAALFRLARATYAPMYGTRLADYLVGSEAVYALMEEDLAAGNADAHLAAALDAAGGDVPEGTRWADRHTLRVSHPLGNIPVLGGSWRFAEFGVQGSLKTVFKTANDVTNRAHRATYGANSRHISDLSDIDANWFVLLGGQDGWLGSEAMLDQVELWRTGGMVRVPMRPESVRAWARHRTALTPTPAGGDAGGGAAR